MTKKEYNELYKIAGMIEASIPGEDDFELEGLDLWQYENLKEAFGLLCSLIQSAPDDRDFENEDEDGR